MIRSLVTSFVRSSLKEDMRHQIVPEDGSEPQDPKKANPVLQAIARLGGFFITPSMKTRIQGYLINKYRIPVSFVPPDQLREFFAGAIDKLGVEPDDIGDYLEFGVYQGNSMMAMAAALKERGMDKARLFGFDSFEGLPAEASWDGPWSEGEFRSDIEFTRQRLREGGVDMDRLTLVKGFFSDTLEPKLRDELGLEKASIIMMDGDLYTSARDAFEFCTPLVREAAIILLDDWNSTDESGGEKKAFREFLEANPELTAEEIGTYSPNALVFIVRRSK